MDPPLEFMFIISLILNEMPEAVMTCCVQLFKGGNPFLAQLLAKETGLSQSVVPGYKILHSLKSQKCLLGVM